MSTDTEKLFKNLIPIHNRTSQQTRNRKNFHIPIRGILKNSMATLTHDVKRPRVPQEWKEDKCERLTTSVQQRISDRGQCDTARKRRLSVHTCIRAILSSLHTAWPGRQNILGNYTKATKKARTDISPKRTHSWKTSTWSNIPH